MLGKERIFSLDSVIPARGVKALPLTLNYRLVFCIRILPTPFAFLRLFWKVAAAAATEKKWYTVS